MATPYKTSVIPGSTIRKPLAQKDEFRVQLTSHRPKGGARYSTTIVYDQSLADDLEYIWNMADEGMDLDLAKAVIIRRAIICYRQYLMGMVADWHKRARKLEPLEAMAEFQELMQAERDELVFASGKKGR